MQFTPLTINHIKPWRDLLATVFNRDPNYMEAFLNHYLTKLIRSDLA